MISLWNLPTETVIGASAYTIHTDYRDIIEIFSYFSNPDLPEFIRWQIALALFYEQPVPVQDQDQAMEYLSWFINGGSMPSAKAGPKLLDWQQDAAIIVADVNKVAGQEIRALPFVHWWTFLSWFHGIGEGQVSALVTIRDKLRRGKKLEGWEKEFYKQNREKIRLKQKYSPQEQAQKERLEKLLG